MKKYLVYKSVDEDTFALKDAIICNTEEQAKAITLVLNNDCERMKLNFRYLITTIQEYNKSVTSFVRCYAHLNIKNGQYTTNTGIKFDIDFDVKPLGEESRYVKDFIKNKYSKISKNQFVILKLIDREESYDDFVNNVYEEFCDIINREYYPDIWVLIKNNKIIGWSYDKKNINNYITEHSAIDHSAYCIHRMYNQDSYVLISSIMEMFEEVLPFNLSK